MMIIYAGFLMLLRLPTLHKKSKTTHIHVKKICQSEGIKWINFPYIFLFEKYNNLSIFFKVKMENNIVRVKK